jgi:hypothetical protein
MESRPKIINDDDDNIIILEYECKRGSVWGYQQEKEKERVLGDEMI